MTKFDRSLPEKGLALLESAPAWWRDVLDYRFTDASGKQQPLFLAVRDGYLNAYVEGQSVFKISCDEKNGSPRLMAEIHHKYVDTKAIGQKYLPFDGNLAGVTSYLGKKTLAEWVKDARKYAECRNGVEPSEKQGVTAILGNNPQIIDVEMGLPLNELDRQQGKRSAPRMDIVALEKAGDAIKIVFYEAKLFGNSALRADDLRPKVLGQLKRYEDWIASPRRVDEVAEAYREACRLLVRLNAMRSPTAGGTPVSSLAPLITQAAEEGNLEVDTKPRLIVFGYRENQRGDYWARHEEALRDAGVALIMQPRAQDVMLP